MKVPANFKLIGISVAVAAVLAACGNPGPAEVAGKKIDQTAEAAGKKVGEAADKMGAMADRMERKVDEQSAKAGVAMEDTEITAKVKAAFLAEPGLKSFDIIVDTIKGVVTLTGAVDSGPNSDKAKALAFKVDGVKEVDNRLVQKPLT